MSRQESILSDEFIENQRKRLIALRDDLLRAEGKSIADVRTVQEETGQEAQEYEERAQDMAQNEVRQALHDTDARRLRNIDRALQKIAEGTYGISDMTGKPIPKTRLDATPEAVVAAHDERQNPDE